MAEAVIQTIDSVIPPQSSGRAMIDGRGCLCGDAIKPGDLVLANFDSTRVSTGGGLYLLQTSDGWRGCRRMMRVPDGIAIDKDGHGDWKMFSSLESIHWHVVAVVETVYRPTHYQ